MKKLIISSFVLLSLTSCSQRLIDFTVISSKNVNLNIDKTKGKRVSGKSMMVFAIGVHVKDAVDKALEKAGPDYDLLVDGVVRVVHYPFWGGYKVEGTAISTTKLRAQLGEKGFEEWCNVHHPVQFVDPVLSK